MVFSGFFFVAGAAGWAGVRLMQRFGRRQPTLSAIGAGLLVAPWIYAGYVVTHLA